VLSNRSLDADIPSCGKEGEHTMRHSLRRLVRTILGGTNPRAGTGLLTCSVTLASALWVSVSVPNLPFVRGLDDRGGASVAISLQSALLGIDDRSGDTASAQTLARRLGLSPDIAKLLTPGALADRANASDASAANDPVAQLDRSVAVEAAPAVQPPGVPRSPADVTPSSTSIAPTAQPGSEPAADAPPPASPVTPPSRPKSGGGTAPAAPSQPSPPSKQPPLPPGGQAPPVDPPATAPAVDPPASAPVVDTPHQDPGQSPPAQDVDPPVIQAHADVVAEAAGPSGAAVPYTAPTASDAVDGTVAVSCAPASGSTFAIGHTTVTCSAHDATGNQAAARSFDINVRDTTAPAIQAHGDLVAEASGAGGATVSYTAAAASDAVDGSVSVSCAPASGTTFALGHTTVTCTAQDAKSNVTHSSFDVDVRDTTAPVIQIPADIAVAATSPAGAAVSFSATATDAVDGTDVVSCGPSSGTTFAVGQTTVTCTAGDAAGNQASSQSFSVFVTATQTHADDVHALLDIDTVMKGLGLSHLVEQDLHRQLIDAATADVHGDAVATCQAFDTFTASASVQLTPGQLATLTPSIDAARTTLGC
jgi:HYR domain